MQTFIAIIFFVYGLVLGSFYNVVGLRVPIGTFWKQKQSYCYTCKRSLSWTELIPVISYLNQKGKCKGCGEPFSALYPIMEFSTGILFALSYLVFGFTLETIFSLIVVSMVIIITVSDIAYQKIPNKILLFFAPLISILLIVISNITFLSALIGAGLAFALIFLIIILSKGGMGMGDLKYFTLFGFIFGWKLFLLLFLLSTIYGAAVNSVLLITKKVSRKTKVPFGPYIGAAALTVLFFGNTLLDWYLSLL
ncbi:A24 family peptidase [Marinilactibacillus sp. Marseille-P9653]|uniref:prepilin peptidase n=1 Tax=Marinilactibacillus sp. Marseille-P9653 TaxID=2866583 RepID=UPI001CE3DC57|nr:A24 family peptidase [Marinilactibacillus sp. Marseille-P9653]